NTLWVLLAVEANTSLFSVKPSPHVLLVVRVRNSKLETSGLKRYMPCENSRFCPAMVPLKPEYPTTPQIWLSIPYRRFEGPAWVSNVPQPSMIVFLTSALSSPSVSFRKRKTGACDTIIPSLEKVRLVGMFRLSAKIVNLSALPSPSVSSHILMRSSPTPSSFLTVLG